MNYENVCMAKKEAFKIRIHDNDHPPPHCHVYCSDGSELVITLPLLIELFGKRVNKKIRKHLEERLDELTEEWDLKNPEKHN